MEKIIHVSNKIDQGSLVAETSLSKTLPGVKRNGDEFVADWQLPGARRAEGRPVLKGRRHIVALGSSLGDIHLHAKGVDMGSGGIRFEADGCRFAVSCLGQPPRWGEKGDATQDLSAFAAVPGARLVNGGGLIHSGRQLAGYHRATGLGCAIHAIDTSRSLHEATAELAGLGVQHTSLGLAPAGTNLVLTNDHVPPEALVLRSPALPSASLDGQAGVFKPLLGPDTLALLINSPQSVEAAAHAVSLAKASGVRVCTALTPSLPMAFRLERLFSRDETLGCNRSEFCEITSALGISYSVDDNPGNMAALARAMSDVAGVKPCGDLAVPVGETACVVGDATTGGLFHIGLTAWALEKVRVILSLHPEKINGSDDGFFAVFATEHALFHGVPMESSRALHAARLACLEVVRSYSRFLDPDPGWFSVRTFTERFGA